MSKLKIEKNVPIPSRNANQAAPKCTILRAMEKGDSVYISEGKKGARQSWRAAAYYCGFRVITRKEGDGFRLWRGEDVKMKGAA